MMKLRFICSMDIIELLLSAKQKKMLIKTKQKATYVLADDIASENNIITALERKSKIENMSCRKNLT